MSNIYYPPSLLARGGPPFSGPTVDSNDPEWAVETYAVALAGQPDGTWQVVHVHTGHVVCDADSASEAADYIAQYADTVDQDQEAASWTK